MTSLDHFLDLARVGKDLGAARTERAAREIALLIAERAKAFDAELIDGLKAFVDLATEDQRKARRLLG